MSEHPAYSDSHLNETDPENWFAPILEQAILDMLIRENYALTAPQMRERNFMFAIDNSTFEQTQDFPPNFDNLKRNINPNSSENPYIMITDLGRTEALTRRGLASKQDVESATTYLMSSIGDIGSQIESLQSSQAEIETRIRVSGEELTRIHDQLSTDVSAVSTDLQERLGTLEREFTERLDGAERQFAERLTSSEQAFAERLRTQEQGFAGRLSKIESDFYGRIIPLLALIVSAFALLISGAQISSRITDPDPWRLFLSAVAVMAPVGIVVVVLVAVAWGITRVATGDFWPSFWQLMAVTALAATVFLTVMLGLWFPTRGGASPSPSPTASPPSTVTPQ